MQGKSATIKVFKKDFGVLYYSTTYDLRNASTIQIYDMSP